MHYISPLDERHTLGANRILLDAYHLDMVDFYKVAELQDNRCAVCYKRDKLIVVWNNKQKIEKLVCGRCKKDHHLDDARIAAIMAKLPAHLKRPGKYNG